MRIHMELELSLEGDIETDEVIALMELLQRRYASFHQQMLNSDVDAIGF